MKTGLTVVWFEFFEGGKVVDNWFDLPASVAEAHKLVRDCKRFPFQYQIAANGTNIVNWTFVKDESCLPFVAE